MYGDTHAVAHGISTELPDFDFETYSEAGYRWVESERKWHSLEGIRETERGLGVVGVRNYVQHPSFEVLCLSYNLKRGVGARFWRPGMPTPDDLLEHVRARLLIEAWNVEFELTVWNYYCVAAFGWPALDMDQLRCAMAKARAFSLPSALDNAGKVLQLKNLKDPKGKKLIQKLTVPHNPTSTNPARRWSPPPLP